MLKHSLVTLKIGYGLHTACILNGQPGKVLRKIMGTAKKRKFYVGDGSPVLPSITMNFGKASVETKITGNPKRSNKLNKLFMRHVTDIMGTGEYSKEILGYGIEVNKVQVSSDYKFLRVYWIAKESEKHDEIADLLKKNAGHLTHELTSLRVVGQVPTLVFVKDKNYSKISEMQEKLNKADFGEDFERPDIADQLKSEFEILTTLANPTKTKLARIEAEPVEDFIDNDLNELPPMPQNVLGLDHADILKRIKKRMSVSRATHRSSDASEWSKWSEFKMNQHVNQDPVIFANHQEQRKAFKSFLQQRQLLKIKQHRLDKNWTADRAYLEEELTERHKESLLDEAEFMEEDYILEEVESRDVECERK